MEENFQYNNTYYSLFIAYIVLYYLIEQYSRHNFNGEIVIFCIVYFLTILYDNVIFS